ncbi:flagellar hook-associated protein FlgK [Clostridiaceae bacterium M8S5]|nr:flagellar hook-associated protein FlgK [Clostridiaceae bacterium M8S5]
MSGWLGFSTGVSGLLASQRSLYTTNHNLANIQTDGYSRQKGTQNAQSALYLKGLGYVGTGTTVEDVRRIRDEFVDFKYWTENASHGDWEIKKDNMHELENIFGKVSDNKLSTDLNNFYKALGTLSTNPQAAETRKVVKEAAITLTKQLNQTVNKLYNSQKELNFSVMTKIKQVNDFASQIGNLNKEIKFLELDGSMANDLRDQRDLLVDKLSKLVNVTANEENGEFSVSIKGITLVNGKNVNKLKYPPNLVDNPWNPKEKLVKVEWESNGEPVHLESGEIKSLIEMRDGDGSGSSIRGIPFYIKRLNQYAQQMVKKMNEIHFQGQGLEGHKDVFLFTHDNKSSSEFFTGMDYTDPAKVTAMNDYIKNNVRADNITVSLDIQKDVNAIATGAKGSAGVEDSTTVKKLLATRDDIHFFDSSDAPKGKPEDFVLAIISTLSVDSSQAARMEKNQSIILKSIIKRRTSISGVSMDEETANLVKFQHAYRASAKIITTMDKIYDITINNLGYVGR